jgi:hypothetical protein
MYTYSISLRERAVKEKMTEKMTGKMKTGKNEEGRGKNHGAHGPPGPSLARKRSMVFPAGKIAANPDQFQRPAASGGACFPGGGA